MASVTLSGIHKRYPDGFHAVRGVDLSVADGELVVLVGPSGCGKSTTLRMIAGLEEVTDGDLMIGERRVNDVAPGDRDIAMVFQNYALYPHMTVRKNLSFGLRMRRTPKAEIAERIAAAAGMLGLDTLLDRRPAELSGGQRQRVALGRAIVRDPAVFLFDEPLSNLDAKLRGETRTEIAELHQRLRATMIYVTHDQVEAMTLGQRLVLMNEGVVQQVGAPLEVYRQPANRFVATFIGSPAMNLIDGEIAEGRFAADGVTWPVDQQLPVGTATLGVRPDDLRIAGEGEPVLATGTLTTVEQLGHETLAHYRLDGAADAPAWIARLPAGAPPPETASLTCDPGSVHLFAGDPSGRRLN
ncbi:sn-glycerol-3-phosphate import ATP-binding protein UgpC [Planctomycetes bacterium MalM25]|nr:sn-glycerol-3-phosphate import ATP-binding protein UgpC [Planctomycetes bacterium MalM25]